MTISMRCVPLLLTATLIAVGPSTAVAESGDDLSEEHLGEAEESGDVDAEDLQQAQEAFDRGASYYYEGKYGDAIREFRRAQQRYPHPIFAHNIARANESLERYDRALDAAREAHELHDEASSARDQLPADAEAANSGLIVSLETRLTSQSIAEAMETLDDEDVDEIDDIDAPPEPSRWGLMGWTGVALTAVGTGALAGAAVMDRQVASDIDALEDDPGDDADAFQTEIDSLEGRQTAGQVFLFSGAGMLAVGSTLMILELASGPDEEGLSMGPSVTRPGVEMTFRW